MTALANDVVSTLADASVRAALVAGAVVAVLWILRVRDSRVRHAALTLVLAAMLTSPVMPRWLPAVEIPLPVLETRELATSFAQAPVDTAPAPPTGQASVPRAAAIPTSPETVAPAPVDSTPEASPVSVALVLLTVWTIGVLLCLARFAIGWWHAARLWRSCSPAPGESDLYESGAVATPLTVGVWQPRIILPATWRSWPVHMRQAAVTHERAHVKRRDTLTAFASHLNCIVFWFHPVAWWLDRRLAAAAEQACDDAVLARLTDARAYAELLVRVADAVRAQSGRVAWQALGMAGGRSLPARLDYVLSGVGPQMMSRSRALAVAALCALIATTGVACQRQVVVEPLREDPELAAQYRREREERAAYEAARSMSRDQVAAVEAAVEKNPADVESRRKLLIYYNWSNREAMDWNERVAARRPHLLYMIEHHPTEAHWPMPRRLDPAGWDRARALWLAHVNRPDVTPRLLGAAANFFRISEKPMAESLLLKAQATDPTNTQPRVVAGVVESPWSHRLGELYARAIVGSDDDTLFNVVRSVSLEEANGSFAHSAKAKLAASNDATMLIAAGDYLERTRSREDGAVGDQRIKLPFDHKALGASFIERGVALDPNSERAKTLVRQRSRAATHEAEYNLIQAALGDTPWTSVPRERLDALPPDVRLIVLPHLVSSDYSAAENDEYADKDRATLLARLERVRGWAQDGLALADAHREHPKAGTTRRVAHLALGLVEIWNRRRESAADHLRLAADGPPHAGQQDGMLDQRLTTYLLQAGERESVAEYYERRAAIDRPGGADHAAAAKAIREGRMPRAYQARVTPR